MLDLNKADPNKQFCESTIKKAKQQNTPKINYSLEKSPQQDGYIKTNQKPKKKKNILTILTSAFALGAFGYAIYQGKENIKLKNFINDRSKEINGLREALSKATNNSDPSDIEKFRQEYLEIAKKAQLDFDPMVPPPQFFMPDILKGLNIVDFTTCSSLKPHKHLDGTMFSTEDFKRALTENGTIKIEFPKSQKIMPEICKDAQISPDLPDLGKAVSMKQTIEYGVQINWSNEKIARDILQNFYDGHGNTLDGVQMFMEKLPDGKTRIRIEGKGVYKHTQLENTGYSKKSQNKANAGGFGEGAKVLSNSLLASKKTDNIKYGSSNWILEYLPGETNADNFRMLMSRTSLANQTLDGNFIEFTTGDDDLVSSIIDATNYFSHSKNTDFSELDFFKGNFGFSILDEKQQGNFYLTQRFEYKLSGNWDNKLEGIKIIFTEKPDLEEFKRITEGDFKIARDRLPVQPEEIRNLVHYFAHKNMTDEEIVSAIKSTMKHWNEIVDSKEQIAIGEFLNGLVNAAKGRKIGLNIGNERIVAATNTSDNVVRTLKNYGYTFAPKELAEIGIPKSEDIYSFLSVHKPIQPNEVEIKKLKLLEEAMVETYKKIQIALMNKLQKFTISFDPNKKKELRYVLEEISNPTTILDYLPNFKKPLEWYSISGKTSEMSYNDIKNMANAFGINPSGYLSQHKMLDDIEKLIETIGKENMSELFEIPVSELEWSTFRKMDIDKLLKKIELLNQRFNTNIDLKRYIDNYKLCLNIVDLINTNAVPLSKAAEFIPIKLYSSDYKDALDALNDEETIVLINKINKTLQEQLQSLIKEGDEKKITEFINSLWEHSDKLDHESKEKLITLRDYMLITQDDLRKPRYLFDRHSEIAENTLGEAIVDMNNRIYNGHWIDRTYFDTAEFDELYATWLHEICHKGGGDGTSEFTYILTDLIKVIASSNIGCEEANKRLRAIEEVYNSLPKIIEVA